MILIADLTVELNQRPLGRFCSDENGAALHLNGWSAAWPLMRLMRRSPCHRSLIQQLGKLPDQFRPPEVDVLCNSVAVARFIPSNASIKMNWLGVVRSLFAR